MTMYRMDLLPLCLLLIGVAPLPKAQGLADCQEKVADVVFLLDSSFSMWPEHFSLQLSFLSDLVSAFTIGPNNIRVGVVTFSTKVRLDVALNQHGNKEQLQEAIAGIQYMTGLTHTGDAIRFAREHMFTEEGGSRPWAAHILILITDGFSNNLTQTALQASMARSEGVQIFVIGVGNGFKDKELRAIASDPDDSHVFYVESFDVLKKIEKSLTQKTCHKTNGSESKPEDKEDSQQTASTRCGGKPADIYFLLDSSSSIWSVHFKEVLQFVSQLLHLFDVGPERTRVGVAVYSDDVTNVVSLTDRQTAHSVRKALRTAPYLTGGTNTGKALHYVSSQGMAEARPGVAHVVIVLTDGQSANTTYTLQEARAAHEQGIYVLSVGIGPSTDVQELMDIASDPDENFVFHVDNFTGLHNIRELLAIKTCDVQGPDYQGDRPATACDVKTPADVVFVYDGASVSRHQNEVVTGIIRALVTHMDPDPHTVRFGLVRHNCYKGDNIDLRTGADVSVLQDYLDKTIHHGLHSLLKRVRLHGYLTPGGRSKPRSRKVMVLFITSKMADAGAVEKEVMRLKFQGVGVVVVALDTARDKVDVLTRLSSVPPVLLDSGSAGGASQDQLFRAFCQLHTALY
ncbi:matrilin-1-like [Babylonia areolata]|uniref:matrilin-1-like n=1 Tax=Babylonia areolata TaxID=304850 RepID=UPI003FD16386